MDDGKVHAVYGMDFFHDHPATGEKGDWLLFRFLKKVPVPFFALS